MALELSDGALEEIRGKGSIRRCVLDWIQAGEEGAERVRSSPETFLSG